MAKQNRLENSWTVDGRIIRHDLRHTTKGPLMTGCLKFGGSKNSPANFINFNMWDPDDSAVDLIERVESEKLLVKVRGYVRQRQWENKDGQKRSTVELNILSLQINNAFANTNKKVEAVQNDDDIPF